MPRNVLPRHLLGMVVALSMSCAALAGPPTTVDSLTRHSTESLARRALGPNKDASANAIGELRSMGPEGLSAFLEANSAEIEAALSKFNESSNQSMSAKSNQVLAALDSICQQKDCYASRLHWYTDLEQANAHARTTHHPLLSLPLLARFHRTP